MQDYKFTKQILDPTELIKELKTLSFSFKFNHITINYPEVWICTDDLSVEESSQLQNTIDQHKYDSNKHLALVRIREAVTFGKNLIEDFTAENVVMGITQAGKSAEVLNFLSTLKSQVETGSLYAAMDTIDSMIVAGLPLELDPFITESRLLTFKQRISTFLSG